MENKNTEVSASPPFWHMIMMPWRKAEDSAYKMACFINYVSLIAFPISVGTNLIGVESILQSNMAILLLAGLIVSCIDPLAIAATNLALRYIFLFKIAKRLAPTLSEKGVKEEVFKQISSDYKPRILFCTILFVLLSLGSMVLTRTGLNKEMKTYIEQSAKPENLSGLKANIIAEKNQRLSETKKYYDALKSEEENSYQKFTESVTYKGRINIHNEAVKKRTATHVDKLNKIAAEKADQIKAINAEYSDMSAIVAIENGNAQSEYKTKLDQFALYAEVTAFGFTIGIVILNIISFFLQLPTVREAVLAEISKNTETLMRGQNKIESTGLQNAINEQKSAFELEQMKYEHQLNLYKLKNDFLKKESDLKATFVTVEQEREEIYSINDQLESYAKENGKPMPKITPFDKIPSKPSKLPKPEKPDFFDTGSEIEFTFDSDMPTAVLPPKPKPKPKTEQPKIVQFESERENTPVHKEYERNGTESEHAFRTKRNLNFYELNAPFTCQGLRLYLNEANTEVNTLDDVVSFVTEKLNENNASEAVRKHEVISKGAKLLKIKSLILLNEK